MSYILDALRRADAERERGAVPGLHAQQFTLSSDDDEGAGRGSRTLLYVSIGLGAALVAALAWKLLGSEAVAPPPALPVAAPAAPLGPTPAPIVATMPTAPPASAPLAIARPSFAPASAATLVTMTPGAPARSPRTPASAAVSRLATSPAANPAAPPGNRIYAQAELPEEIRRGLPKMSVGGASYSSDAASRMIIINGQVLHEGDKLGNGLVLQQIKLKAAVLSTRGYRFEITY